MAKLLLHPHPDSASPVARIEVELARAGDRLSLSYSIVGDLDDVAIPSAGTAGRADGLWRETCFEAFLAADVGYYEYNFSPSARWAAYRFDAYRQGMRDAPSTDPAIGWRSDATCGQLASSFALPPDVTGPLGLSAIIEDKAGNRSFWALAHPPGAPDFHHAACFAAQLPPAG